MRRFSVLVVVFCTIMIGGRAIAQPTNIFPTSGPAGIGTLSPSPATALELHYTPTFPPILRLTNSDTLIFGALGLMPAPYGFAGHFSTLSKGQDLVLHEEINGDVILTDYWKTLVTTHAGGGFIRLATAGDSTIKPADSTQWKADYERVTVAPNGNVGIDLPPIGTRGLVDTIKDQLQIGGGVVPYPGNPFPNPGLTIYGGNQYENTAIHGGGTFPDDWRYISYNHWVDHANPGSNRSHRFQPMSSSAISFSEQYGGNIDLTCSPYSVDSGIDNFTKAMTMEIRGSEGLATWFMDTTANPYHALFDIFLPGVMPPGGVTRNTNGLTYIHTPLCITSDHGGDPFIDFTNFAHVHPSIGDGLTWMLAVNGAALAKEVYVLDTVWADFVFQPDYKLPSLTEVDAYIKANKHLEGIPTAKEISTTGISLGATDAKLLQKTEELTLYIIELKKEIEALKSEVEDLKDGGTQ